MFASPALSELKDFSDARIANTEIQFKCSAIRLTIASLWPSG